MAASLIDENRIDVKQTSSYVSSKRKRSAFEGAMALVFPEFYLYDTISRHRSYLTLIRQLY